MAMVLSYYSASVDPKQVASRFDSEGYRICNSGTAYGAFTSSSLLRQFNLKGEIISISSHDAITEHLQNKEPILISVGPSRFTKHGHFMVLTGVAANGDFTLNDPNSGIQSATQDEIFKALKFAVYIYRE